MVKTIFEAIAVYYSGIRMKSRIAVGKDEKGDIFVNMMKIKRMEFNHIQLRFEVPSGIIFMVLDDESGSKLSIQEMFDKLKE